MELPRSVIEKAGIYIRKSRLKDKGQESVRLRMQRTDLPVIVKGMGHLVCDIYDDGIVSGEKVDNRPEYKRMIADIIRGHLTLVFALEFSRFSRDETLISFLEFLNTCKIYHVKIGTPNRIIDPNNTSDWLMAILEGGFAAAEQGVIKKRLKEGREKALKEGRWLGGIVPQGYILKDKKLVRDPAFKKLYTLIVSLRLGEVKNGTGRHHRNSKKAESAGVLEQKR